MNRTSHDPTMTPDLASDLSERAAYRTDEALAGARRMTSQAARSLQSGIDDLRDTVPSAVSRAAARAEDMTRRGLDRARQAADDVRLRAHDLGDATVHRIQEGPVKSVLVAAAVGVAATLLVQWLMRERRFYR